VFVPDASQRQRCSRCHEAKPVSEFAWRRRRKLQRDTFCRPCRSAYGREHYLANKQRYIDQARASKQRLRTERTRYLPEYFRTHPCTDCGETDPMILEFHHLDRATKSFDVGGALDRRNWPAVLEEMKKCEVVCANCHKRRHYRLRGTIRAALANL
jgi:hypothetical protein